MATIYYSVMGEGRGHAARARAVVERLRSEHRFVLFTSHDALEFLQGSFSEDSGVEVVDIPGLVFHYTKAGLDNVKTVREGLTFWASTGRHVKRLLPRFEQDHPDLVITDFEPLVSRAAARLGVPVMSLDHQHFLSTYDLSILPSELQRWAWLMSWSLWAFRIRAQEKVVSAFFRPPVRQGVEGVTQVGPLLRETVRNLSPSNEGFVLSYLRRGTPGKVVERLSRLPVPIKIYGLGGREASGSATFHAIDERTFVEDLAACDAVIGAAGNQSLGEALYFGKPVLALPERSHYEQRINSCFLQEMGAGEWRLLEEVTEEDLKGFLQRRETYREKIAQSQDTFDGVPEAVAVLERMLTGTDSD